MSSGSINSKGELPNQELFVRANHECSRRSGTELFIRGRNEWFKSAAMMGIQGIPIGRILPFLLDITRFCMKYVLKLNFFTVPLSPIRRSGSAMMEIVCDKCGKQYKIDETKITKRAARISCKACDNIMLVVKPHPENETAGSASAMDMNGTLEIVEPIAESSSEPAVEEPEKSFPSVNTVPELAGFERVSFVNSIQARISAILIFITTAILLVYAFYSYSTTKSSMETELVKFSEITAERLSNHLVEPFWSLDDAILEDSLESEMMNNRIYTIIIMDRDRETIYMGKTRDGSWRAVKAEKAPSGDLIKARMDIAKIIVRDKKKEKEILGVVDVYLTKKFMNEEIKRFGINIAVTIILLIVTIFVSVLLMLRRIIIRPLRDLTDASERMSMGDLDVQIFIHSRNEIGLLAQAIERMQTSLRFAMEKLGL